MTRGNSPENDKGIYESLTETWPGLLFLAFTPFDQEQMDVLIYLSRMILGPKRVESAVDLIKTLPWFIDDIATLIGTGGIGNFLPLLDKETLSIIKKISGDNQKDPNIYDNGKNGDRIAADGGIAHSNAGNSARQWQDLQAPNTSSGSLIDLSSIPFSLKKFTGFVLILAVISVGFLGVVGSGSGFVNLASNVFGSEVTTAGNAAGDVGGGLKSLIGSGLSTATCAFSPGCLQEMRLNQSTQTPGSEQSGQEFQLEISNPTVEGQDNELDIANFEPGYEVPISFTLENTKEGVYGINATNIEYRVSMFDPGINENSVVCSTDWINLNKAPGTSLSDEEKRKLVPGESATPLNWQENNDRINLRNCGLLQPDAFREDKEFRIDVRYDYYTTSSLTPRAMSRQHMLDEEIDNTDGARSEAPDTPVRSYFNLRREPLHYRNIGGSREAIPEDALLGIKTERDNIEYRLNSFELQDSSRTQPIENRCTDLEETGENTFEISEEKRNLIEETQSENWLDSTTSSVTQMRCRFKLAEESIDEISPTGETLTFSVESSYRVEATKNRNPFTITNRDCSVQNCQMLDPLDEDFRSVMNTEDPQSEDFQDRKYAKCNDWDDDRGCSILTNGFGGSQEFANQIVDDNDIAINVEALKDYDGGSAVACNIEDNSVPSYTGIDESKLREALNNEATVLSYSSNSWSTENIDPSQANC